MARVTKSVSRNRAKKRLFKRAKGFVGGRRRLYRTVAETVTRAEVYATRDRRVRKRDFRRLWITRMTAALRLRGMSYSRFINGLSKASVELNRKVLAALAISDPAAFDAVVGVVRESVAS